MSERQYWIEVEGFDGFMYVAASAAKAKWRAFVAYDECGYGHSRPNPPQSERFKRFLARTVCHAHGATHDHQI